MKKIAINLRILRKIKNVSQELVADELKISRSRFASYEESRAEPPYEILIKISDYYHVSIDAILRGDFSKTSPSAIQKVGANRFLLPILIDLNGKDIIEVIDAKASAGYLNGYADPDYVEKLSTMKLPFSNWGKQRAFPIKGDSMPPLQTGDYVIGKYLEHFSEIKSGKTYVLITKDEGIVYKRLHRKNNLRSLELHSDNKNYEAYSVKIEDVLEIWEFVCCLSKSDKKEEELNLGSVMNILEELRVEVKRMRQ
jgi:transcriptional regulator with XRE-family HTH domain